LSTLTKKTTQTDKRDDSTNQRAKVRRRATRQVNCGGVKIGGSAQVSIQSMTNTDTRDVNETLAQIRRLEEAGCDIVRCAVPDTDSAAALKQIIKDSRLPVVADIHFDHRLALAAIEAGADKIRINPGNIGGADEIKEIVKSAGVRKIPIRIGVNSGSLEKEILAKYGGPSAEAAAESALSSISFMESLDFENLVVSIKLTDLFENHQAHLIAAGKTDHPFHIGITEAGLGDRGIVKSAIGAGALLINGIGDTIRVSLTGDPVREVKTAREILGSLSLRKGYIQVNSCPTCGRCKVDLERIALRVKEECEVLEMKLAKASSVTDGRGITVAVMGCVVNGPGEAAAADIGVACGSGKGAIFKEGNIVLTVDEDKIVDELMKGVRRLYG
jgi:(E)-4-hydroxy-3-methylbut-2-enyl-diphosphate synthase